MVVPLQFKQLRERVMPFAEAQGYLTDEEVFRDALVRGGRGGDTTELP